MRKLDPLQNTCWVIVTRNLVKFYHTPPLHPLTNEHQLVGVCSKDGRLKRKMMPLDTQTPRSPPSSPWVRVIDLHFDPLPHWSIQKNQAADPLRRPLPTLSKEVIPRFPHFPHHNWLLKTFRQNSDFCLSIKDGGARMDSFHFFSFFFFHFWYERLWECLPH